MVSALPDDVLRWVSDYLHSDILRLVCRRLWRVLQQRHVSCSVTEHTVECKVLRLKGHEALHSLSVKCVQVWDRRGGRVSAGAGTAGEWRSVAKPIVLLMLVMSPPAHNNILLGTAPHSSMFWCDFQP